MSGGNVTRFPGVGDLPENPVTVERPPAFCRHSSIRIVEQDRQVLCARCGATLDPFDYLRGEALAIRQAWDAHRMVDHEVERLRTKIELLKKEAARIGAQVRKHKAKEPPPTDFRKPL